LAFENWTANTPGGDVRWVSVRPYIIGASLATYSVWFDLFSYEETVDVTPSGPFLAPDPSNPYLIRYLIQKRWLDSTFSENAPDLSKILGDVPEGADA
jgi:hypothetical protein